MDRVLMNICDIAHVKPLSKTYVLQLDNRCFTVSAFTEISSWELQTVLCEVRIKYLCVANVDQFYSSNV